MTAIRSECVKLGHSDVKVSRLGLGTAPLAGLFEPVAAAQARDVVHRALKLGLNHFDTAPLYGCGEGERRLGEALATTPRESVVVATKAGRLLRSTADRHSAAAESVFANRTSLHPVFDFSADGIRRSLEESLERLGLDRVDIVHLHDPDDHYELAISEALPALERLRGEGVVKAIGVGMTQADMLTRFAKEAAFDCFLLAGRYTLLDQTGLDELLPTCAELGAGVIVGGVYNTGVLVDPDRTPRFEYAPAERSIVDRALRIRAICATHDVPLAAAAIQFPFGHPAVTCVLTGSRSPAELEYNARMFDHPVPEQLWDDLRTQKLLPEHVPTPRVSSPISG